MRYKRRSATVFLGLVLLLCLSLPGQTQEKPDEKLLKEAKVLIFDAEWAPALEKLEALLKQYPKSEVASRAIFYRAECLDNLPGREAEALEAYRDFLRLTEASASLKEEAEVSLIEVACKLYSRGDKGALKEVEDRLASSNKVVQYYAALKLSAVKDKEAAAKSVPVLRRMIQNERDPEITDRARIALMRVDPEALNKMEPEPSASKAKVLIIQVFEGGKNKVNVRIPLALADLALQAIPENEKAMLRKKGYDLDKIFSELSRTKTSVLEFEEEDTLVKIWID